MTAAGFASLVGKCMQLLASLKLTLLIFVLLGICVVLAYAGLVSSTWGMVVPLSLLAVNLLAAVSTRPLFRIQRALLLFHLCLIAIVLLVAAGRLTYLRGTLELAQGEAFGGQLLTVEAGPWHDGGLEWLQFINDGFRIDYAAGIIREQTRNAVRFLDAQGREQSSVVGDHTPLVLQGYRFYTSANKGFAPAFIWYPAAGEMPEYGTVHLPSYPINQYRQSREWQIPGTTIGVWTMLQFDEVILDPAARSEFRLPQQHQLVVRIDGRRYQMQPGQHVDLPQGRLEYVGLRTWMGYNVFYDWTLRWLLAACVLAIASLGWHFWNKFTVRSWDN